MSHEKSITVQVGKKWWNIPTVVGGKTLSERRARSRAIKSKRNLGVFNTEPEASRAARMRSEAYIPPGKRRKKPARPPRPYWKMD